MLEKTISLLPGVGPKRLEQWEKAGVHTIEDLCRWQPRSYRDFRKLTPVAQLSVGQAGAFEGCVLGPPVVKRVSGMVIISAWIGDKSGRILCTWFQQIWMKNKLQPNSRWLFYGTPVWHRGSMLLNSPVVEPLDAFRGLQAVYKSIEGVGQSTQRKLVALALEAAKGEWTDKLPEALRQEYQLPTLEWALEHLHRPESLEELEQAKGRLAFEELLLFQLAVQRNRQSRPAQGVRIQKNIQDVQPLIRTLPYTLTDAQQEVIEELLSDMRAEPPMARLLQGDVGCGKTIVAFVLLYAAHLAGWQGAMMAPTDILARQHYQSAQALLEPLGVRVGLLVGALSPKERRAVHQHLADGELDIVFGTHALISKGVQYNRLGLVITDEQHRFGVKQRTELYNKGDAPNLLVMSATPIPRTMALVLYGDLQVSIIRALPFGRIPVKTRIVPPERRNSMFDFLRACIQKGQQAYVVCPLVEESQQLDVMSAKELLAEIQQALPDLTIEWLHGRMRAAEKDEVMERFLRQEVDILVSTTVIEVGVNVPNATVMCIENAERFGLSQLHQLRGRVGRGTEESWCFLVSREKGRLEILTKTTDGFVIAEEDLNQRGPGEIFGQRQSGFYDEQVAGWIGNVKLIEDAQNAAMQILERNHLEDKGLLEYAKTRYAQKWSDVGFH